MIVSIAIDVLPVWRSPMISSRWPRPIGIIASIAFSPVCIGSLTGWRWTTPGALNSAGRVSSVWMSPLPSSGWPSGETMRPSSCSPTGMSRRWLVRLTVSPSTILSQGPNSTVPTLSDSRLSARPVRSSWPSSRPSIRLLRMDVISSGLICIDLLGLHDLLAKLFESVAHGCVEDGVADPHHDPTQDLRVDVRRELHLAVGLLGDAIAELLDDRLV